MKITDILSIEIKRVLDSQVEHLKKLSMEDTELSAHWRDLHSGAETIMTLLDSELGLGRNNGISLLADKMDLDELRRYQKLFSDRIEKIESEPKVKIFAVYNRDINVGWRQTKKEANALLTQTIKDELDDDDYSCEFGIRPKLVFESEVKHYVN